MKKTLACKPKRRFLFQPFSVRTRLGSGFALLALAAGLGLAASHPGHTAGGPIAVSVANTPLPTTPADVAAPQQPFTAQTTYIFRNGSDTTHSDTFTSDIAVPAGKRLVIQTVSLDRANFAGETLQAYVEVVTNGTSFKYALPSVPSNETRISGVTQSLTAYADPGSSVPLTLYRSQTSGKEVVLVTVTGYLVNA